MANGRPELTRRLVALLTVGSGLSVAANYYAHPLLPELADGSTSARRWSGCS